jgi:dihydrofolate reductase
VRKIVSGLFITLDGVVEAPAKWNPPFYNEEMTEAVWTQLNRADAMLLGRHSYRLFSTVFAGKTAADIPVADWMNKTPKFVVSNTLRTADWENTTVIGGDLAVSELEKLKEQPGRDIHVGASPTLVRWLLRQGLLDELNLILHPLVVGTGMRLFDDSAGQVPLKLEESTTFSTGVVSLWYAVSR